MLSCFAATKSFFTAMHFRAKIFPFTTTEVICYNASAAIRVCYKTTEIAAIQVNRNGAKRMKLRLQRGVSALLATMMLGQLVPTALAAPVEIPKTQTVSVSQENVAITEAFFPDAAFRSWLENPANINGYGADGVLTAEELANIRSIDVANQNLTSLQGIEVFFALETLDCKNNALTALDVRQNTALKHLHCAFNRISTLDVSGLTSLISLNCEHNGMTELDLTGCAALEVIYCRNNNLSAVDFSTNSNLKFIRFLYKGIIINHNKNRANLH